jgi:tetratricopeptide (TPR) repeat protein
VHRRGYRIVCRVEQVEDTNEQETQKRPPPTDPATRGESRPARYRPFALAGALALVIALVIAHQLPSAPSPTTGGPGPSAVDERAIVAVTVFPTQKEVPDWVAPAALELLTRLLASDERVLVLRGEKLGLDAIPADARWQHAMRELLGAPVAVSGYWRMSGDEILLDYNLIELDTGRQLHGGQLPGTISALDSLMTLVADDLRDALQLPPASKPAQWLAITSSQRQAYWQGLADLGRSDFRAAAEQLQPLHEELQHPAWLAPATARALRLSGQPEAAREVLSSAMDAPDVLRGLGASLRLRAEMARLEHDPAEATGALRALTALFPDETDLLLELATAELDSLDGDAARRTMVRLEQHSLLRHDPRLKLLQARLARLEGDFDQAISLATSAVTDAERFDLAELAVQSVLELAGIQQSMTRLEEASETLDRFLQQWQSELTAENRLVIALRRVALDRMRGHFVPALERLHAIETEYANGSGLPRMQVERALIESEQGHFRQAMEILSATEPHIRAQADPELAVAFFSARGRVAAEQGLAQEARTDFAEAFEIARRTGQAHHLAGLQVNAGLMLARQRRFEEAERLWEDAMKVFEKIGDGRGQALCLSNLAASAAARGLDQRALELNQQGLDLFRRLDMSSHVARTTYNLGLLARRQGQLRDAVDLFDEASRSFLSSGSLTMVVAAGTRRADALTALGRYGEAEDVLAEIAPYYEEATDLHRGDWHATHARLRRWTGDIDGARDALLQAKALRRQSGSADWLASTELERLEIELLAGTSPGDVLRESEQQLRRVMPLDQPRLKAKAFAMVAEALVVQQRHEEARIQLREARAALSGMPDVLVEIRLDWLEAWAADEADRYQHLQELARRARDLELGSRMQLLKSVLDIQPAAARENPVPVPSYASNHHTLTP